MCQSLLDLSCSLDPQSYVKVIEYHLVWLNLFLLFWSKFKCSQVFKSLQLWSHLLHGLPCKCLFGGNLFFSALATQVTKQM